MLYKLLALVLFQAGCQAADQSSAYHGVVEHEERVLAFEVGGRIESIDATRGARIARSSTVAKLETKLALQLVKARRAELAAREARLALLRAGSRPEDIRSTELRLESLRALEAIARRSLGRSESLERSGAATPAAHDQAAADLERATAERTTTEERLKLLRTGSRKEELSLAQAELEAARAGLDAEEERLAKLTLVSPLSGRITAVHQEPGEVVAAGTPVASVADTQHPYIDVFVPEGLTGGLRVGLSARLRVDSESKAFAGHVEDIASRTEFTPRFLFSERERTNLVLRVRVRVEDPEERLLAGLPAEVRFDDPALVAGGTP